MKITDVKTVLLTGPCTNDRFLSEARKLRSAAFIEIYTDGKLIGLGETYAGYSCPEPIPAIVDFFKPILVGQNVDDVPELWNRMYHCGNFWCRVGLGAIVLTGIEAALWDLKGKIEKKPVHELLGGCKHKKLLGYATGGPSNYPKSKLAEKVDYYMGLGFKGFKVGAGCYEKGKDWKIQSGFRGIADFEADKVAFLREHCGPDAVICLDGHMGNSPFGTWDLKTAKAVLKACEPYGLFFYEEPLPYTNYRDYAELTSSTKIPVAGGECLSTMSEWQVYLDHKSFAIAQPDAAYNSGLGHFMTIAKEWEKRGKKIATHAWGAGGSLMQNIHCGFAAANTCILELPPDAAALHTEIVGDSFQMKDGYVLPPQTHGLGIRLTDAIKKKYRFVPGTGEFNSVPGKELWDDPKIVKRFAKT
jgi:galactonate dehydratase